MKLKRSMFWLSLALVPVILLSATWAWNTDLGRFKPWIEEQVSAQLGRTVSLKGPLSIRLGVKTRISARQLEISNPEWAVEPTMLSVGQLDLQIDLRSLMNGPLLIDELVAEDLEVTLEVSATGQNSWEFKSESSGRRVLLPHVSLRRAQLIYRPDPEEKPAYLEIERLDQRRGEADMLELDLLGRLNEQAMEFKGTLGPFGNLVAARDVRFEAKASAGFFSVAGSGMIDDLFEPRHPQLNIVVKLTDLTALERFLPGYQWPRSPFQLSIETTPAGERVEVSLSAQGDGLNLQLDGDSSQLTGLKDFAYRLHADGRSLDEIGGIFGFHRMPPDPFTIDGRLERQGSHLGFDEFRLTIGAAELVLDGRIENFPDVHHGSLTLNLRGPDISRFRALIGAEGSAEGAFSASLSLQAGTPGNSTFKASVETSAIQATASGRPGPGPAFAGTDLEFNVVGDNLRTLLKPWLNAQQQAATPAEAFSFQGGLGISTKGYTLRDVEGKVGTNSLTANGLLSRAPGLVGSDLEFSIAGPNLKSVLQGVTEYPLAARPFSMAGRFLQSGERMSFEQLALRFGQLEGRADLSFGRPFDGSELEISARLEGPDVRGLVTGVGGTHLLANPVKVVLEGRLGKGIWHVTGSKIELGSAEVLLEGSFDQSASLPSTQFSFSAQAPRLDQLFELTGRPGITNVPIAATGELSGTVNSISLSRLTGSIGNSDLTGHGSLSLTGEVPYLKLSVHSEVLDLLATKERQGQATTAPAEDDRAIPDIVFPMHLLKRVNADFDVTVDKLVSRLATESDAVLRGSIRDGGLIVKHFGAKGLEGEMQLSGSLLPAPDGRPTLDLALAVSGLVLDLRREKSGRDANLPSLNVELAIDGSGPDLRSVAASLNGHLYADAGAGTIPNSLISRLDAGIIRQLIDSVIPAKARSSDSNLKCFAARLEVNNGQVKVAPGLILVTDKVQMISRGEVNLSTEALSLSFESYATKLYQANISEVLINPFVRISGTLARPQFVFDKQRALLHGGAAAATAGLSIVAKGLVTRLSASDDPCGQFIREQK